MDKRIIFAKEDEYIEYLYRSNKDNKIRRFFNELISDLPTKLKKELKHLPTNLVQSEEKINITGGEVFIFKTKGASKDLLEILNQYLIVVEKDTEEIIAWKSKIKVQINSYSFAK